MRFIRGRLLAVCVRQDSAQSNLLRLLEAELFELQARLLNPRGNSIAGGRHS